MVFYCMWLSKCSLRVCSLILAIDSFSPKPASVPKQRDLVIIYRFFAILKTPNRNWKIAAHSAYDMFS